MFPVRPSEAPWPVGAALIAAVIAGAAFAFVFGLAVGVVSIPVTAFVLWRGVGARRLTLAAAVLLGVAVPLAYVVHPGSAAGGNHFGYAHDHLAAHYLAVAAIVAAYWGAVADACCVPGRRRAARLKDLRCLRAATSSPSTGTTTRGIDRRDPGRLTQAIPHGRTR